MGKKYCTVGKKWCKLLRHGVCTFEKVDVNSINRCKRLADIETVRFYDILREVTFEGVLASLEKWYPGQQKNINGYLGVFNTLCIKRYKKHNLNDLFIDIKKFTDNGEEYIDVAGVNVFRHSNTRYSMEFVGWNDLVSMFITRETLDTFTKEDIVAGCMYEVTYFGFQEHKVRDARDRMLNAFRELREEEAANAAR